MSANLNGAVRDKLGSRFARKLRLQGRVPASIQGENKDNVHFSFEEAAFLTARRHHEHLFDIQMDRGEAETALVNELQWDAFGERIVHVEFRRVIRGQKTEAEVALDFIGHPKGGILNHLLTHLTVLALPSEIPDLLEVKVDSLEPGDHILAGEVPLPEGVELASDPEAQVAVVAVPKGDEDEAAAEEEAEGEAADEAGGEAASEDASDD